MFGVFGVAFEGIESGFGVIESGFAAIESEFAVTELGFVLILALLVVLLVAVVPPIMFPLQQLTAQNPPAGDELHPEGNNILSYFLAIL